MKGYWYEVWGRESAEDPEIELLQSFPENVWDKELEKDIKNQGIIDLEIRKVYYNG
jgi:hypothetical protein